MDSNNKNAKKTEFDQSVVELRDELERERRNRQTLEEMCRRLDAQLCEYKNTLDNNYNNIESENAELEFMISRLQEEIPGFKHQINELKESLEAEREARAKAEDLYTSLQDQQRKPGNKTNQNDLTCLKECCNRHVNDLASVKRHRNNARVKIAPLKQRVKDIEEQFKREESAFLEKNNDDQNLVFLEGRLDKQNKLGELSTQLSRREECYRDAIIKNDKLKTTKSCLQKEIQGFKYQIHNLKVYLEIEREARAEAESLCRDLQGDKGTDDMLFYQYFELMEDYQKGDVKLFDEKSGLTADLHEMHLLEQRIEDFEKKAALRKTFLKVEERMKLNNQLYEEEKKNKEFVTKSSKHDHVVKVPDEFHKRQSPEEIRLDAERYEHKDDKIEELSIPLICREGDNHNAVNTAELESTISRLQQEIRDFKYQINELTKDLDATTLGDCDQLGTEKNTNQFEERAHSTFIYEIASLKQCIKDFKVKVDLEKNDVITKNNRLEDDIRLLQNEVSSLKMEQTGGEVRPGARRPSSNSLHDSDDEYPEQLDDSKDSEKSSEDAEQHSPLLKEEGEDLSEAESDESFELTKLTRAAMQFGLNCQNQLNLEGIMYYYTDVNAKKPRNADWKKDFVKVITRDLGGKVDNVAAVAQGLFENTNIKQRQSPIEGVHVEKSQFSPDEIKCLEVICEGIFVEFNVS